MAQVAAVVVAAGRGVRAGGDLPKQFRSIGGQTALLRTLVSFLEAPNVGLVQPVIRPEDAELVRTLTGELDILVPVFGGSTRQASVRPGLEALLPRSPDIVLRHDAPPPFARPRLIQRALAPAQTTAAALP